MQDDDPRRIYRARWRVRQYEVDVNGHLNNAVYLNYAEQVAVEHAEALGFGRAWSLAQGGTWVVRKHVVEYLRPGCAGDVVEVVTRVESMGTVRAYRATTVTRLDDGQRLASMETEWVWVRLSDGRPDRIPAEVAAAFWGSPPADALSAHPGA